MAERPTSLPQDKPPDTSIEPRPRGAARSPAEHSGNPAAAALPLIAVGAVLVWWAWERGAYFGVTFLPGALVLLGLLAALLLYAPWPAALRGPAAVAMGALFVLGAWTLVSALWSSAPDVALEDGQRVLLYGSAFALGLWLCLLLGRRMLLSLAPIAASAALVAIATLIALWVSGDVPELLEDDATLRYPLGYRNAAAAYFLGSIFPILVLSAGRELDWRLRGLLLGSATLCLELAALAQSRGSVFAIVLAVGVLVAVHPARLRMLAWLALAVLPAAAALPWVLDVFQHEGSNTAESLDPLHSACAAMAVTSAFSVAVGAAVARYDRLFTLSRRASRGIGWSLAGLLAAVGIAGLLAVASTEGGPVGFIDRHVSQLNAGTTDLSPQGSRFGTDLRDERGELWRVAFDDFSDNPITGEGAGGFRASYLLERDGPLQPEDPHSVEMLMASELGIPGLLLFAAFALAAVLAVLRARKLGSSAAVLAAGALAFAAYWFGHASVDWFWSFPALTLPVMFALGAAAAPALLHRADNMAARGVRRGLAAAAALLAIALVPFLFSERYTNHALDTWRADLGSAYADLDRAADLNPVSGRPLAAEAVIAEQAGEPQRALAALSEAQGREPQDWTLYYLEARILAPTEPAEAARALARARELNPEGQEIAELQKTFRKN